jgi:hypothetical protein
LVTFHEYQKTPETGWDVFTVIVNKPNTRLVVISYDQNQENVIFKLCTQSGKVIWQMTQAMSGKLEEIVLPVFSEDGKHFAVFQKNNVHILDAHTAAAIDVVAVKDNDSLQVTAIAISKNGKDVAVSSPRGDEKNVLEGVHVPQAQGTRPVYVVSTSGLYDLALTYTAGDRRLIATGKERPTWRDHPQPFTLLCWDIHSRKLLLSPEFGARDARIDSPLHTLPWAGEPSVLVRLRRPESTDHSSIHVYTADGRDLAELVDDWILHTICGDKVIILKNGRIQMWGSDTKHVDVAIIEYEGLPPMQGIKGFAVSESFVTLVLDDERFILLRRS